ncbi:MAG: flippase-like domain-containing protein [Oscillospiraceae bacterium]|nr:flippase-like domain-containing protein [Oscillospiraceae bacterium]
MSKNSKKKSNKLNLIVCGIAFIVMVVYLLFVDKLENVLNALRNINPIFLVVCVLFMIGYWLCESATVHSILKPLCPAAKFEHSWLDTIIGQYFNCITPFASGGQPMQAYYFVQFGVPLGSALTALLSRFIVYQFVLTAYSVFTLCIGFGQFGDDLSSKGLMPFVFIGFVINTAVIVFLMSIALWKSGTVKAANALITLLTKIHVVKNPMHWRLYFTREVNKFHTNFKFLRRNVWVIVKSCIYTFVQLTLYLSISYVLYRGFGLEGESLLKIISYQAYVLMISSFIPLPGAMGAAELGYAGFFKDVFGSYTGVSTMLWRIFTFYLPILVGMFYMLTLKNKGIEVPDKDKINQTVTSEIDSDK